MKPAATVKTWQKTRLQNLVRHKSGRYYARAYANGKEVWQSLKTSHFGVAQAKLSEFLQDHRARQSQTAEMTNAKLTFGAALRIHEQTLKDNRNIKPSTVHYWSQIFAALLKSWPELAEREVRKISPADCAQWAARFTGSPTRFNNTVSALRHVFDVAVNGGILYRNPAARLKRMRVRAKQLELPSREQFIDLVRTIRRGRGRYSRSCADFVEGLALTGMRKSESSEVTWRDLNFKTSEVVIRGDSETGTKNWEVRRVPMIPEARELYFRMRSERGHEPAAAKVFRVRESQKAIDAACKKLGIDRVTHHDLRHLFATTCIESGIDIPTVSRWLGHKDGGVLALKTYGHLRAEHSAEQAKRVRFGNGKLAAEQSH
jgi:integrase